MPPCTPTFSQPAPTPARTFRSPSATRTLLAAVALLGGLFASGNAAFGQSVATTPVGAMTTTIEAGTGAARKLTPISIPLVLSTQITGKSRGAITSVTTNTITVSDAGWQNAQLSSAQTPYFIRITSGNASGRIFLLSTSTANTSTTLTIDSSELVDLVALGVASEDSFNIIPVHTLASLLDLTDGVLGGINAAAGDNILINKNGVWNTYFYNTSVIPNRWSRVALGSPDASNEILRPDSTIIYSRLDDAPIELTFTGEVPSNDTRLTQVRRSGLTFLSNGWPVNSTLATLGIQNIPGWIANSSSASADKVLILSAGVYRTYYFDGTNWRQVALGNPIRDNDAISATSGVLLNRLGASSSTDTFSATRPYTL